MQPQGLLSCYKENCVEAGLDEAGRGCLAGPVTAAAVILPEGFFHPLLNDSKKLTEAQRDELRIVVEESSLAWEVSFVSHEEIDKVNILNASFIAMNNALERLTLKPHHIIVDGNRFRFYTKETVPYTCIVKGDGKYASIAAASILAKTHRDEYMKRIHSEYPVYDWESNKGYPTQSHRKGIKEFGISPFHRRTFALLDEQLDLFE